MKESIAALIAQELSGHLDVEAIVKLIETPPSPDMGDFSFPCFSLSRSLRKSPNVIAVDLMNKLTGKNGIENITVISGYLNIFLNKAHLVKTILEQSSSPQFGKQTCGEKVVIEFASPNTNKPLHLGHLRNMAVGESVARISQFAGNTVTRASINNDRGVHICKSMLAYSMAGNGDTPESTGKKSDHFVGDYYVLFSKKAAEDASLADKAQELLCKWEAGDPDTRKLWKTMNQWALEGFAKTYALFGIKFDKEYFESNIYTFGKEIINEGLERGIFSRRSDGATIVDLDAEKLGEKVLLRSDGTSVYIVQDLYLAVLKKKEFDYDRSVYVVGNEQEYHFSVLKAIFKKLGYEIADQIHHLSYGMVELPEGKMKSREGTVVDADDLIGGTSDLAAEEVRTRYQLSPEEVNARSLTIALAAIKYQLLRVDTSKNMLFDPKKAISFEGDTGPYLLYSYARASSIIRKSGASVTAGTATLPAEFNASEVALARKISCFPEAVAGAYRKMSPSLVAAYAFELSQAFNEFYHNSPVLGSTCAAFRLQLVGTFRAVLKNCLWLLGIEAIEEM